MARCLGESDIPGYDSPEDFIAEEFTEIRRYLTGEVRSVVEHRQENSLDLQWVAKGVADPIDRIHKLRNPFQGKEFTLDRHENGIRRHQGIECQ